VDSFFFALQNYSLRRVLGGKMSPFVQLLIRTGQAPKLLIGLGLLTSGILLLALGGFFIEPITIPKLLLHTIVVFALCISGFIYLCFAIKCQNCDAKWIWLMASTRLGEPNHITYTSDQCPVCENKG
jgi:hypothetical protein